MQRDQPSSRLTVRATAGAALVLDSSGELVHGPVAALDALPRNMRRRLSTFDRMVARCVMGLADPDFADETLVLASRYGNMKITLDLLGELCAGEPMSPAGFSASVHNAALGFASLLTNNHGGHVAIAAADDTTRAGLIEACIRLNSGADSIMLVIADEPLPGDYAAFDPAPDCPAACLALRLCRSGDTGAGTLLDIADYSGRPGLRALAEKIARMPVEITCPL